jgi:excisionase family DNA binding protein
MSSGRPKSRLAGASRTNRCHRLGCVSAVPEVWATRGPRSTTGGGFARAFHVSRPHAYRLAARGEIPTIRLGGCIRVDGDALEQRIAEAVRPA